MGALALACKQPPAYMRIGLLGRADGYSPLWFGYLVDELALIKISSTP